MNLDLAFAPPQVLHQILLQLLMNYWVSDLLTLCKVDSP